MPIMRLLLLICLMLSFFWIGCRNDDDTPLPGTGRMVVEVNGNTYAEPVDAIYDFREEEGEDVLQGHLLLAGEIGFSITLRSPGERTLNLGFFSPDTADGLKPCAAVLVLNEDRAYDAVAGRAQVMQLDWDRRAVTFRFDLQMVSPLTPTDTIAVAGAVQNALLLQQE